MAAETAGTGSVREPGFWATLFGGEPDHDTAVYDRSVAGGSTVVSVQAPEEHVDQVLEILESHHPIDIDERAAELRPDRHGDESQRASLRRRPAARAQRWHRPHRRCRRSMQLSEESLAVGKRVVNRGGTRIRRFVVETPVEENVSLHSEKVTLDRRPVTDGRAPPTASATRPSR